MNVMTFSVVAFYSFWLVSGWLEPPRRDPAGIAEKERVVEMLKQKEETARRRLNENPDLLTALSLAFLAVLFWGVALDVAVLVRRWRGHARLPAGPLPPAGWNGRDVFYALMFLLFIEACLFFAQDAVLLLLGFDGKPPDTLLLLNSLVRDLCVAAFVWRLVKGRYGQGLRDLGLRFEKAFSHVRTGVLGYVAVVPPLLVVFLAVSAVLRFFSWEPAPQEVVQMYLKRSAEPYLVPLTVFVALIGPAMEELFFRGFAYAGLRKRFGALGGACISSAAFAALHMHWAAFAPIFLLGLLLAYLYECSGSLVPSITAHMLHNLIMVALMLGFKGLSA